jgi:hypothetical protein
VGSLRIQRLRHAPFGIESTNPGYQLVFTAAVLALLLPFVLRLFQEGVGHIGCLSTWDDGVIQIARAAHDFSFGAPLYSDLRKPPYYALEYTPLLPYTTSLFCRRPGSGIFTCVIAGRLQVILTMAAACMLIFLIATRFASVSASAITALGFAVAPINFPYCFELRPHTPAMMLELAGIFVSSVAWQPASVVKTTPLYRGVSQPPNHSLALMECGECRWRSYLTPFTIVLFVTAFMTKQYSVAGIAGTFLFSVTGGHYRRAAVLCATWLAAIVAVSAALQAWNSYYWLNIAESHCPILDWSAPVRYAAGVIVWQLPLLLFALIGLTRARADTTLSKWYLAAAIAQGTLSSLVWRSDRYYFMEAVAGAALLSASGIDLVISRLGGLASPARAALTALTFAAVLVAPGLVHGQFDLQQLSTNLSAPRGECELEVDPKAVQILAASSGPIWTDVPEVSFSLARPDLWQPELDSLLSMRARGLFNDQELVNSIRQRRVAIIALSQSGLQHSRRGIHFFWPELRKAIAANYVRLPGVGPPILMVPKQSSPHAAVVPAES